MRFSLFALFALAAPAVFASTIPTFEDAQGQVAATYESVRKQLTFDNPDDACPDLVVRCIRKDTKEIVGDIGGKSFCHPEGTLKCKQCHETVNAAECNAKYLKDCATKCKAVGSPI
ncbi:hypothetical protein JCM10908_001076 [Rhodotorula pacifica]|uniref:uncharacterized protein n=1 Tax=Rhodotorula pacifica TaxID=1495444 RepID=UPI003177DD9E